MSPWLPSNLYLQLLLQQYQSWLSHQRVSKNGGSCRLCSTIWWESIERWGIWTSPINLLNWQCAPNTYSKAVMRTQWVFRRCSHSLIAVFMCTQWVFRGCSILTHWHSRALTSVQGVFNTDSKVFKCTHKHSGRVQFWHEWELCHGHTMVSRVQQWLKGGHVHSMGVQGVLLLTHWHSCALNGCSGGVQYSLIGVHVH
jgi:hypothetical protein